MVDALSRAPFLVAAAIGATLGLGAFTFDYGEGLSYFSKDPKACRNCHIMNPEYASWLKGPHHQAAVCIDCHLPHDFVRKYLAKADNGYRHSKGFTFQDFHEPIYVKPRGVAILQENCMRCHGDFVHGTVSGSCVHCHRGAGHGARG